MIIPYSYIKILSRTLGVSLDFFAPSIFRNKRVVEALPILKYDTIDELKRAYFLTHLEMYDGMLEKFCKKTGFGLSTAYVLKRSYKKQGFYVPTYLVHLQESDFNQKRQCNPVSSMRINEPVFNKKLGNNILEYERYDLCFYSFIQLNLRFFNGDRQETAKHLRISKSTLFAYIKTMRKKGYDIPESDRLVAQRSGRKRRHY